MAADRAAKLTQQLLTFGRKQFMQMEMLDINEVIQRVTQMLRRVLVADDNDVTRRLACWKTAVTPKVADPRTAVSSLLYCMVTLTSDRSFPIGRKNFSKDRASG